MKKINAASNPVSLAIKYQNPTEDQQAAALKIQIAVGEKLTGVTTINPQSTLGPRTNSFLKSNLRQISNKSESSVNQLSKANTSDSFSFDHRFLLLCRALALGFESQSSKKPKLQIHCTASIVDLATKVPSLPALAKRMTEANSVALQSVMKATGNKIGRGNWFAAAKLKALCIDSTDAMQRDSAFMLGIDMESFRALALSLEHNPFQPDETVTLAELALNISESLIERRGFLMPSLRAMLKPLATEKLVGDEVAVAELNLQVSKSPAKQKGFLMPSWSRHPHARLTSHEIEQLVAGTGGDLQAVGRRFDQLSSFRSKSTATVCEIEKMDAEIEAGMNLGELKLQQS